MSARHLQGIDDIAAIIANSAWHMDVLRALRMLHFADFMVGAGFVRNAVWDLLHGYERPTQLSDVDVIYFDPKDLAPSSDQKYQARLSALMPNTPWSVRNQARMHKRNNDLPYASIEDAVAHWLETPTCVAVKLDSEDVVSVIAPHDVRDLFALEVRPTPSGLRKPDMYRARVTQKDWPNHWPKLKVFYAD